MPELEAETYRIHPFDLTKVWPKSDYPLIEVGQFELNRNPVNWYRDVEQSAFAPSNRCRASARRRTRCCRRACSPTPMRSATGWA